MQESNVSAPRQESERADFDEAPLLVRALKGR